MARCSGVWGGGGGVVGGGGNREALSLQASKYLTVTAGCNLHTAYTSTIGDSYMYIKAYLAKGVVVHHVHSACN